MIKTAFRKLELFAPRPGVPRSTAAADRGVVLIAVLWICALIMWIAFQISAQTRLVGEDQLHAIRKSQALYLAIGGCYEALARMKSAPALQPFDKPSDSNWQPDGQPRIIQYLTGAAMVIIESEDAKMNVNVAQGVNLSKVLQRAGADEPTSEQLADRILDFIDADDIPRPQGMEKDGYIRAGLNYIPFNGKLTSLDQLLLIPGMSHELFYGYGNGPTQGMSDFPENFRDVLIPGKDSLFSLLTIYGNNTNMPVEFSEQQDPAALKAFSWKIGGTYRVLSFGQSFNGPPSVGMWLEVRLGAESGKPFKILSRKVM
jgi:general secretion pathway protein K